MRSSTRSFTTRTLLLALGVAGLFAGCGASPEELGLATRQADGGLLIVPASYRDAMKSGGHLKHVGLFRADAGARIECRDCHDYDHDGFKTPQAKPCKKCHEDHADFHHGPSDGGTMADGGVISCLTCHPFEVKDGRKKPLSPWICLDCHKEPQNHKKAIEVHYAACFTCHHPHQDPFTKPVECTVCHEATLAHGAQPGLTVVQSCMQCHDRHTPAKEASKGCVTCHSDASKQKTAKTVVTDRALFTTKNGKGHDSCGACHKPHRFAKNEVKTCTSCHDKQVVLARAVLAAVKNDPKKQAGHQHCLDCHDPHAGNSGAPKACTSCHDKIKNTHPPAKDDAQGKHPCFVCHPPHEALATGEVAKPCAACHDDKAKFVGVVHGKDEKTKESLTCNQCHSPHKNHAFKLDEKDRAFCKQCHEKVLASVAKAKKDGHVKCEDCHSGLPHKPGEKKPCLECHKDQQPPQKGHAEKIEKGCLGCHDNHSGAKLKGCTDCHKVAELPGLHVIEKHQKCETCHSPHGKQPFRERVTCEKGCHDKQVDHEPKAVRCNSCHLFRPAQPGDTPADMKKKK